MARSEIPGTASREPATPSAAPPPRPQPAPAAPASSSGGGAVVGSYALQENAYALRDYYRSQNVRAGVERVTINGRPMFQVRIWR